MVVLNHSTKNVNKRSTDLDDLPDDSSDRLDNWNIAKMFYNTSPEINEPKIPQIDILGHSKLKGRARMFHWCHWVINVTLVDLTDIQVTGHFEISAMNNGQKDIEHYINAFLMSPITKSMFCSTPNHLWLLRHKFQNDPKLTLNTTRSKVPHTCTLVVSPIPKFQPVSP